MFTLAECRSAIRAASALVAGAESRAMRAYWQGVEDMWKARARELERASLAYRANTATECGVPRPFGNDEYRCTTCGLVWARDEERPLCPLSKEGI